MFESRNSPVICSLEIVEDARVDRPVTVNVPSTVVLERFAVPVVYRSPVVKAVADAIPSEEVPDINVENVPKVKVGLSTTAIVEVPESNILDPAFRYVIGLLKKEVHCEVEDVSGIEYPSCVDRENVCVPELDTICKSSPFAVDVAKV